MTTSESTIFSKIINREIPADIIYEDDVVLAFLDINPINYGHSLVIPKQPFVNALDGDADSLAHMMRVGQKIARALAATNYASGINLIMNNGADAGQEVFHAHLHVVPRHSNDNAFTKPTHITPTTEANQAVYNDLKQALT